MNSLLTFFSSFSASTSLRIDFLDSAQIQFHLHWSTAPSHSWDEVNLLFLNNCEFLKTIFECHFLLHYIRQKNAFLIVESEDSDCASGIFAAILLKESRYSHHWFFVCGFLIQLPNHHALFFHARDSVFDGRWSRIPVGTEKLNFSSIEARKSHGQNISQWLEKYSTKIS